MPAYRGVDQAEVLRSINDALELLETHSIGPACQTRIDALRQPSANTGGLSPLTAIANATDDVGLAAAINASGVNWLFMRASEVLTFHAVANTDGKGLDVLERLHGWGALSGMMTHEYNDFDEAAGAWLAGNYARLVKPSEENLQKIAMVSEALTDNQVAFTNAFAAITQLVEKAAAGATDAEMRAPFLALDLHERHIVCNTLAAVSTLKDRAANLTFDHPMSQYGVVVDDLMTGKMAWGDPKLGALAEKIGKVLEPFREVSEVNHLGVGLIGTNYEDKNCPQGIVFGGTLRAAQAVADAFPELRVIDYEGHALAPNVRKPAPKKGFKL
jgi:hypothetical protein